MAFRRFEAFGGLRYHGRYPEIELAFLSWRDFSVAAHAAWLALAELMDIRPALHLDTISAPIVFRFPQNYTYPADPVIV